MPVLDGITATRLLLKARPHLPVVYLSADVTEETKRRCVESGAVSTLLKPVNRTLLLSTIRSALQQQLLHGDVPTAAFRCLVVDDVSTNRMLAAHLVKRVFGDSTEVAFADSGQAAVTHLTNHHADLVLMVLVSARSTSILMASRTFACQP